MKTPRPLIEFPAEFEEPEVAVLEPNHGFEDMARYIGQVAEVYAMKLGDLKPPEVEIAKARVRPEEFDGDDKKNTLQWRIGIAEAIGPMFACHVEEGPRGSSGIFWGERLGAEAAAEICGYVLAELDRFTPSEYLRLYKRRWHSEDGDVEEIHGWRKDFIQTATKLIEDQQPKILNTSTRRQVFTHLIKRGKIAAEAEALERETRTL